MPLSILPGLLAGALWQTVPVPTGPMAGAQAAIDRASDRFRVGDFSSALAALREAEPVALAANDPALATIRFNIARCHEELGALRDAHAAYERYLGTPDEPHRKERAWTALRSLEDRLFGGLDVRCRPSDARVGIPGVIDPPRPCPLLERRLEPGRYTLVVQAPGFLPGHLPVEVPAGAPTPVDAVLVAEASAVAPASDSSAPRVWPWLALGVSLVAAGTGGAFTVAARDARDEAEALPPTDRRDDAVARFERNEALSWVGFGLSAAALGAALTLFFWPDDTSAAAEARP